MPGRGSEAPGAPTVWFVSGCAGDTRRYRVFHQAEALWLAGWNTRLRPVERGGLADLRLGGEDVVICHRVEWSPAIAGLIEHARNVGCAVLYDCDDLIFEPRAVAGLPDLAPLPGQRPRPAAEVAAACRRALDCCDGVLVPTAYLAARVRSLGKPVVVVPNALSLEQLRLARQVQPSPSGDRLTIGYVSGTPTHDRDFAVAQEALQRLLRQNDRLWLRLHGYLTLDDSWRGLLDRVERVPYVSWRRLLAATAELDVNLAPLVMGDPFCESKSELKYFEAGIVGVPTVASATGAYREAIEHGRSGLLARSAEDWYAMLQGLLEDPEEREAMGLQARADVMARYLTDGRGAALTRAIRSLCQGRPVAEVTEDRVKLEERRSWAYRLVCRPAGAGQPTMGLSPSGAAGDPLPASLAVDAPDEGRPIPSPSGVSSGSPPIPPPGGGLSGGGLAADSPAAPRTVVMVLPEADESRRELVREAVELAEQRIGAVRCAVVELGASPDERWWEFPEAALGPGREPSPTVVLLAPSPADWLAVAMVQACGAALVTVGLTRTDELAWSSTAAAQIASYLVVPGMTALVAPPLTDWLVAELLLVLEDASYRERLAEGSRLAAECWVRWLAGMPRPMGMPAVGADAPATGTHRADADPVLASPARGTVDTEVVPVLASPLRDSVAAHTVPPAGLWCLDQLQPWRGPRPLALGGGRSVAQSFTARLDGLARFDVRFAAVPIGRPGEVHLEIRRGHVGGPVLERAGVAFEDIVPDEWTAFSFPPLAHSGGERFVACLAWDGPPEADLAVWVADEDVFAGGRTYLDDQVVDATLSFRTFCRCQPVLEAGKGQAVAAAPLLNGVAGTSGLRLDPAALEAAATLAAVRTKRAQLEAQLSRVENDRLHGILDLLRRRADRLPS